MCSTWSRIATLGVVPYLAITVDAASIVAVDADVVASEDEARSVVLELDVVGIVAPVVKILGELVALSVTCAVSTRTICSDVPTILLASRLLHHSRRDSVSS